jgi:hypothetical protein
MALPQMLRVMESHLAHCKKKGFPIFLGGTNTPEGFSQNWLAFFTPSMKIAQIAPLYESVPPKCYGGTEWVVSYVTETLVEMGHKVTLYASGDSVTKADVRPICQRALRLDRQSIDPVAHHVCMAERVFRESHEFDLIHSHVDYLPFPLWRRMSTPHVTTLHGRLDIPDLQDLYREFQDEPLISVSTVALDDGGLALRGKEH